MRHAEYPPIQPTNPHPPGHRPEAGRKCPLIETADTQNRHQARVLQQPQLKADIGLTPGIRADPLPISTKVKKVTLIISSPVGGGYNRYARTVARHLGKYIPGKLSVILKNMPGAGGIRAANYLYSRAPQDGSTIGSIQNTVLFEPLWSKKMPVSTSTNSIGLVAPIPRFR